MFNPKKLRKVALILLGLTLIIGPLGYFFYQRNIFGQDRLRFEITAPDMVSAGEEVEYIVRYRNNSDSRLEDMILTFEYPENSIPVEREEDENIKKRGNFRREVNVGELNPGEEKTTVFKAVLIGKEGTSFESSALIRYVPKNLAARYESKREHIAIIDKVPINFDFQIPSTVDPDRENSFRLRFSSDIDYPLTDLEVRFTYPSGFRFIRSSPKTEADGKNMWTWPVLNKGDDGTIDVDGVLLGDPGDAKIFNALLGVYVNDNFIVLKEASRGTAISRSNLILDMQVNGRDDYVASPGELLHYEIFFRNIGKETLEELFLLVDLDGNTLNLSQVEPKDGRFQEERGVIIWSHTFDYALLSLKENEEGRVEFWARVRGDLPYNPEIKVKASIERAEKTLATRVNTRLSLNQEILRKGSPFEVVGPFPFVKGETSNYAVRWRLKNHFNDVRDLTVRVKLPEGARITGEKNLENVLLSFNSSTREVVMDIESIAAGETKEIFFEVEINPVKNMKEEDLLLLEAEARGKDRRTESTITTVASAVFLDQVLEISN
jgi:hypothetical protein